MESGGGRETTAGWRRIRLRKGNALSVMEGERKRWVEIQPYLRWLEKLRNFIPNSLNFLWKLEAKSSDEKSKCTDGAG